MIRTDKIGDLKMMIPQANLYAYCSGYSYTNGAILSVKGGGLKISIQRGSTSYAQETHLQEDGEQSFTLWYDILHTVDMPKMGWYNILQEVVYHLTISHLRSYAIRLVSVSTAESV